MDSQPRAFEILDMPLAGTPPRCPRPMIAQPVVAWTPERLIAALFAGLIATPNPLALAAINRRRA